MKQAMIVCVLVTRAPGKGPENVEYRMKVLPKEDLPPIGKDDSQSFKLSQLRPFFRGSKGIKMASSYRGAAPIINEMKGQGRLKLGEVFYNCANLHFDGSVASLNPVSSHGNQEYDGTGRDKKSGFRDSRKRRNSRQAPPSSAQMD